MEKETKILIGAGALALAYYLYNVKKAAAAVSPIGKATMPTITTQPSPVVTTLKDGELIEIPPYPQERIKPKPVVTATKDCVVETYNCVTTRYETIQIPLDADCRLYQPENPPCLERIDDEKIFLAKREFDRIEAEKRAEADRIAAEEAERQKAMNAFMYPTCPDGFEFYQNNCMPTYIIVEEKAKKGEGLILRDFKNNTTTLVETCPAEYVKQDINCIPRYALSPQELIRLDMIERGMVQTSDGQWYTSAAAAAAAQAIIDARGVSYDAYGRPVQNSTYSARQSSINDAICSVDRDGYINNPNSTYTNGMSLSKYIGEFKVTSSELGIARASCPNSVYSSNLIAGGRTDDNALGYKGI